MFRSIALTIIFCAILSPDLSAQPGTGKPISNYPFLTALEYQQGIKDGCRSPRFNLSCDKLLSAWKQAIPGKFNRIEDVEEFLLTEVSMKNCGSGRLEVAGVARDGSVKFSERALDPKVNCLFYRNRVVVLMDCGNPAKARRTSGPVIPSPTISRVETIEPRPALSDVKDTSNILVSEEVTVKDTVVRHTKLSVSVSDTHLKNKRQTGTGFFTWKRVAFGFGALGVTGAIICTQRKDKCGFGSTQITNVSVNVNR